MLKNNKAFSLIEIIMVIVILGVTLTPFSVLVVNVVQRNTQTQVTNTSLALAEGELERINNLHFSDIASVGPTAFSGPFNQYTFQIISDFVNFDALNTVVAGPTNYKRVRVIVNNSIFGTVELTSVITNNE